LDPSLARRSPVAIHAVDVGRHDEEIRLELARQQRRRPVLVDDDLRTDERPRPWLPPPLEGAAAPASARSWSMTPSEPTSVRVPGSYIVGMPPPPVQMTTAPRSSSQWIGR